jgi:hypothetical protein
MGGKGGGGGGSNNQAIAMEQQAANEARVKEAQRAERLKQGTAAIDALFNPVPIMETRHQKGKVGAGNLPAGKFFTRTGAPAGGAAGGVGGVTGGAAGTEGSWVGGDDRNAGTWVPGTPAVADNFDAAGYLAANPDVAGVIGNNPAAARQHYDLFGKSEGRQGGVKGGGAGGGAPSSASGFDEAGYLARYPEVAQAIAGMPGVTAKQHYDLFGKSEGRYNPDFTYDPNNPNQIVDAQGNVIGASSDPNAQFDAEWDETYDTGRKKDPFDELYNRYETGQRDFYMPELQKQYGDARKKAYLAHAGAGTLWSSMRGDTEADIANQNTLNKGQIESQIQDSLGGLRRQIASDKSSLINQLYATENPEMAANEALSHVKTISQQTPPLSPMGDLFKIAAIGLGNAFGNTNDPYNRVRNQGVGRTSGGTVTG